MTRIPANREPVRWIAAAALLVGAVGCVDLGLDSGGASRLTAGRDSTCEDTSWRVVEFERPTSRDAVVGVVDGLLRQLSVLDVEDCGGAGWAKWSSSARECTFCVKGSTRDGTQLRAVALSGEYLSDNFIAESDAGPSCALLMVSATKTPGADLNPVAADRVHAQRDTTMGAAEETMRSSLRPGTYSVHETDAAGDCSSQSTDDVAAANYAHGGYDDPAKPAPTSCLRLPPASAGSLGTATDEECPGYGAFRRLKIPTNLRAALKSAKIQGDQGHFKRLCMRPSNGNGVFGYADRNTVEFTMAVEGGLLEETVDVALDSRLLLAAETIAKRLNVRLLITSAVDGNGQRKYWSLHKAGWGIDLQSLSKEKTTKQLFEQHRCAIESIVMGVWGSGGSKPYNGDGSATYQLILEKRKDYVLHLAMLPHERQACGINGAGAFLEGGTRFTCSQ